MTSVSQYPTRPTEKKYENLHHKIPFYCRNDIKEFWDFLCNGEKGNRSSIGNHALLMYKAVYENDMEKLAELIKLVHNFKTRGYYRKGDLKN